MKLSEYIPEIFCLLLFTNFSCLWVISLKEDKSNNAQISPLLALEKLIPQHEVQLLNANFSDQQHYDQLAQLQSELEALVFEADVSDKTEQFLKEYKETSLSYTQLASMLKTSQRLISADSQFENTQLMEVIDKIRLKMFSFISTHNSTDKATLITLLDSIDIDKEQQTNWQHLQLVKLHSLFIVDNYELTATYRQKLIGMPVIDTIVQDRVLLQQQIKQTNIKQFAGIFGAILGLVLLFIVVIKRYQYVLEKTSKQHEEFATNLMDMLGPQAERAQTKLTQDDESRNNPIRTRSRK